MSELNESSTSHVSVTVTISSAIFNLPRPIFQIIFGEYLNLKDIARFDNAVLNHRDRSFYLNGLSSMIVACEANFCNKFFFRWLFQRRILLSSLSLRHDHNDDDDDEDNINIDDLTYELFPLNVSSMHTLKLKLSDINIPLLFESLKKCSNLKVLSLQGKPSYMDAFFDIPTICHKLETIIFEYHAADEVLSKLAAFSPNLRHITF